MTRAVSHSVPAAPETALRIRARGHLRAGVSRGIFGLSYRDPKTQVWEGFDVELARALAVAVLGDAEAIEFVPIDPDQRCRAVAEGQVDIGTFNASATLGREIEHDVVFPQAMLYDGEAFMIRRGDGFGAEAVDPLRGLGERIVAVQRGATTSANLQRYFEAERIDYRSVEFATPEAALAAYADGLCNVYALDRIPLTGERLRLARPDDHVILDEQVSKEAMGPVVAARDSAWVRAVTWVMRSLIESEELALDSRNGADRAHEPGLQHFLNPAPIVAERLGLRDGFPLHVLKRVGNYAEVFARTLGRDSALQLPRARNQLWSRGGLLISPSFH